MTAVLRVRINKSRIIVALQSSVHIYQFSDPPTKLSTFETADNPIGLCCLGLKIVAFLGRSPGKVQIVEHQTGNVSIIPAHTSAIRAMDLSPDGQFLATASETGTLIRVFSTTSCTKIAELRRGVDPALIFSIAISPDSSMLAVTSDKSTLHIFDLQSNSQTAINHRSQSPHANGDEEASSNKKWSFLSNIPLLPRIFSDVYSFASAHFEMGDEKGMSGYLPALGSLPARSQKGILAWTDNATILVVGTGRDGRWERFKVGQKPGAAGEGQRAVWREGWKRYLGS